LCFLLFFFKKKKTQEKEEEVAVEEKRRNTCIRLSALIIAHISLDQPIKEYEKHVVDRDVSYDLRGRQALDDVFMNDLVFFQRVTDIPGSPDSFHFSYR